MDYVLTGSEFDAEAFRRGETEARHNSVIDHIHGLCIPPYPLQTKTPVSGAR